MLKSFLRCCLLMGLAFNLHAEQPSVLLSNQSGLEGVLQAVMQNNPSVRGKSAEVRAQNYAVDSSRAQRLPSISVSADNISEEFDQQGTVRIDQPIFAFGKINRSIREAEASYTVEQWDLLRVQRELMAQAVVAYAAVEGVARRTAVAEQNTAEHERLYQRIDRRQQGQLASEADVVLANSRLIQSRAQEQRFAGEMQVARAELLALTLTPVVTQIPVDQSLLQIPMETELQETAAVMSAEIGLRRKQVDQVRLNVAREKVDYLPTVSLRAEHDFLDQLRNRDETRFGVALEANVSGLGMASRGRIRSAAERLAAAELQLDVSRQDVKRQVSVLVANRDTQLLLIDAQKSAINAVESTLESFLRQYETGRKSWVDVLNTQRELTNLRFDLVNFETELLALSLELQALTGGLDVMAGIEAP